MPKLTLLLIAFAVSLTAASEARACGAFFSTTASTENTAMGAQRALYVASPDRVQVHVQVLASGGAGGFAWVVPVPDLQAVRLGDQAIFDALDQRTTPHIEITTYEDGGSGGGCGCGSSDASGGAPRNQSSGGVEHFGGGTVGDYEFDVLAAASAADMVDWLHTNGYAVPSEAAAALQPYSDMQLRFFWAKISPDAASVDLENLDPIVLEFARTADPTLMYPLALSELSAASTTPVVLYTLTDHRTRVDGRVVATVQDIADAWYPRSLEDELYSYDDAVDALTLDASGRLQVVEYAADIRLDSLPPVLEPLVTDQTYYLTRIYLRVPQANLNDLALVNDGGGDLSNSVYARNDRESPANTSLAEVLVLALGALLLRRRLVRHV